MHSSIACPHFPFTLDSTLTGKLIFILQCLRPHVQMQSSVSCPHSSAPNPTHEEIGLSQHAMRDREVLFVAARRQPTQPNGTTIPNARPAYPLLVRLLAHLVLFLCCASPQHTDGNAQSTQQQHSQPQGPIQAQASSLQTQPAAPRRLRYLLLLIFKILRQLQQPRSHDPFHYELISFFLSVLHLSLM